MPAITVANEPEPPESSTFTPTNCALGATPLYWKSGAPVPAVIPAQCVPCPWSSYALISVPFVNSG